MKFLIKTIFFAFLLTFSFSVSAQVNFIDGSIPLDSGSSRGVTFGDIDNDSDLDIYVANDGGQDKIWVNDGTGSFTSNDITGDVGISYYSAMGDVDGDGDLDMYVTKTGSSATYQNKLWINDGTGSFTSNDITGDGGPSRRAAMGDLDGDGDLDIYVANDQFQQNKLWINDGTGSFTNSDISGDLGSSFGVSMGDVDSDGDLDIYVTDWNGQQNKLWINDGTGSFTSNDIIGDQGASYDSAMGDVDGDGDLDIYVANANYQQNKIWVNDGTGSFTANDITGDLDYSVGSSIGDVDGDGDLDIYVGNWGTQNKLWINNGTGAFTSSDITSDLGNSSGSAIGDLDGDADFDIYVANYSEPNIIWLNDSNAIPTAINLSIQNMDENNSVSTTIGTFTTTDTDGGDSHTYSIVSGTGDEDNTQFSISGDELQLNFMPDYENPLDLGDTAANNTYTVRVQTNDGNGGTYTDSFIITINDYEDTDLESSLVEDSAPNSGDGNNDSIPDSEQNSVISKVNDETGKYITLASDTPSVCQSITYLTVSDGSEISAYDFPVGLFDFESTCVNPADTMNVKIYLDKEYDTSNWVYVKKVNTDTIDISEIVSYTTENIGGNDVTVISYDVTDGGTYDDDGLVNSIIVDPAGPGIFKKKKSGGSSTKYVCKDETATNYDDFGRHKQSLCEYGTLAQANTPTEDNPFGGNQCPANLIIHDFMKYGNTNGDHSSYNGGNVTEIDILQGHMNRLLLDEYGNQASGPIDGIFLSLTHRGVERLQTQLNQLLPDITPLKIDGIVGPKTRAAINMSC